MNVHRHLRLGMVIVLTLIITIVPTTALVNADNSARPMQSHDFTDVPVSGQEFMEPFINAFYHQGITGGCSTSPLQYCPTNPVTRGSMAVFMGRALGYVDAEFAGFNTRAYFNQATPGAAYHGVIGESIDGRGVWGLSDTGPGVRGQSIDSTGISGISTNNIGVRGLSDNSYGVSALGSTDTALFAHGELNNADTLGDSTYDIQLGGDYGEIHGGGIVSLIADGWINLRLDKNNNTVAELVVTNGGGVTVFSVDEAGNTQASGSKSAIVDTVHHGTRAMYAVESTEVWFEDAGSAQLVDGEAIIEFDSIFAETVNLSEDYQVFLTPVGGSALLYVAEKTATHIVIRSEDASDLHFDYRIMAKRLGYEDVRLEEVED